MASANQLARLVVSLEAQTEKYDVALKKANAELHKFRKSTETAIGKLDKQFADFGKSVARAFSFAGAISAIYGLGNALGAAIKAGDDLAKHLECLLA